MKEDLAVTWQFTQTHLYCKLELLFGTKNEKKFFWITITSKLKRNWVDLVLRFFKTFSLKLYVVKNARLI